MLTLRNFPTDPLVGRVLAGVYCLERLIARGGMGAVYEARHLRLGSRVAVKVLSSLCGNEPSLEARFQREVSIIKQLDHPHIVRIEDADRADDGLLFFVMEYLDGETLQQRLRREGMLPMAEALRIVFDVCATLAQVHAHGFVHCDMKPANIFLQHLEGEPDFVKLLDFGVSVAIDSQASSTRELVVAGTPKYMAPEQARGDDNLDPRVDQFAVAAIGYEMLTGRRALSPEGGAGPGLQSHPVAPLSELAPWVPAAFDEVLTRALSASREARYPSIARFAAALNEVAVQSGVFSADRGAGSIPPSGRYHVARPSEDRLESTGEQHASGPPTRIDGKRYRVHDSLEASDALPRVHELLRELRTSYAAGMRYQAAEHAEELLEIALDGPSQPTLQAILAGMPLIDRVFAALVGPLDGLVAPAVGATAPARPLSPRASAVLASVDHPMTVAEVLAGSPLPTRDSIRVLAALLRSGALVPSARRP